MLGLEEQRILPHQDELFQRSLGLVVIHRHPETTVTVVDPRHPLCGRSFQVIGQINRPDYGLCFVVWLPEGVQRQIPFTATNLASLLPPLPPIPLDISSLQKLLTIYALLSQQLKERTENVTNDSATVITNTVQSQQQLSSRFHCVTSNGLLIFMCDSLHLNRLSEIANPSYTNRVSHNEPENLVGVKIALK